MAALAAASIRQKRQQRQATATADMRALRLQQHQQHQQHDRDSDLESYRTGQPGNESRYEICLVCPYVSVPHSLYFFGLISRRSSASWKDYREGLKDQDVSERNIHLFLKSRSDFYLPVFCSPF